MLKNSGTTLIIIVLVLILARYRGRIFQFVLKNPSLRRIAVTMAMRTPGVRKYLLKSF
ncbi:hypothetical protein [Salibacterium salarium]|uniref:hypothetical protein n=1 Tax=Salibacterium salarium TaxID=284579 RepID=UPI00163AE391|nr:hypothetical protein [Salibacterium salarium]